MEKKIYTQTTFDQAFVNVVSYLYKEKKIKQKEFAKQLDIPASNLNDILSGGRGVPNSKIEIAKYLLREKYNVRAEYLETGQGPFLKEPMEINFNQHPQVSEIIKQNEILQMKIQELETRITDLRKLNETQDALIISLKDQLAKAGH